jgi:hypothetical protein
MRKNFKPAVENIFDMNLDNLYISITICNLTSQIKCVFYSSIHIVYISCYI